MIDKYFVYKFLKKLTTPFEKWEAYEMGIIDENGNILKKKRELNTREERDAFSIFDRMVLNMKKALEKIPGMDRRLASYAAALYLIKEGNVVVDVNQNLLNECVQLAEEGAPVNAAGSGNIGGLPPDDPPVKKRFRKKRREHANNSVVVSR